MSHHPLSSVTTGKPPISSDVNIRISKIESEVSILRALVLSLLPAATKKFNNSQSLTRGDILDESRLALIDLAGGLTELAEWELSDMYKVAGKIGTFTLDAIKLFSHSGNSNTTYLFVGGPGPVVTRATGTNEEVLLEPAFGVGGIFPHLIRNNIPFFNAQIPAVSPLEWVPYIYHGMRACEGAALLSFYSAPWNNYWPTAVLLYFMARGAPNIFFHIGDITPVYSGKDLADKIRNVRGTRHSIHTQAVRQSEINAIITAATRSYEDAVQDPCGRTFATIHTTQQSPDIAAEIACRTLQLPGRLQTLASRIEAGNILTTSATPLISTRTRATWRAIFAGLKSDVSVYLSYVFELAMPHDPDTLSHIQSSVSSLLDSYNIEPPSEHKATLLPIVVLLNSMLPDPEARVAFK